MLQGDLIPAGGSQSDSTLDPKRSGRARVLATIRYRGQIARVDIAREAGISPATVTAITAELLSEGLIERTLPDGATGGQGRGRPREALKIRGAARLVAGVKVSQQAITILLVDFEGAEIGSHEMPRPEAQSTGDALADQIMQAVDAACAAHGRASAEVSGIGIGLAGQVDGHRAHVHWSSALRERNVDLGAALQARAPCPVFIENDANLVAKAEQLFGKGRDVQNFLVVTIQHGIGLGVVIDGKLYRGARGCGAEFGHTKVTAGGALCQCGQHGCLEAYAGEYALLRKANADTTHAYADLTQLLQAARTEHSHAARILREAEHYFALGLANLINIFDPELIILAVETAGQHPLCRPCVLAQVADHAIQVDAPLPDIAVHNWGDHMWAKGAAAYGIERISDLSVIELGRG